MENGSEVQKQLDLLELNVCSLWTQFEHNLNSLWTQFERLAPFDHDSVIGTREGYNLLTPPFRL